MWNVLKLYSKAPIMLKKRLLEITGKQAVHYLAGTFLDFFYRVDNTIKIIQHIWNGFNLAIKWKNFASQNSQSIHLVEKSRKSYLCYEKTFNENNTIRMSKKLILEELLLRYLTFKKIEIYHNWIYHASRGLWVNMFGETAWAQMAR